PRRDRGRAPVRGRHHPEHDRLLGGRRSRGLRTLPVPFDLPRLRDTGCTGVADRRPRGRFVNPTASRGRMLWWGCTKRCARCGSGHLFRRWFTMVDDCPRCGLHFEREQGYWAGALAINIGIAGATFVLAFAIGLALTAPHI